MTKFTTAIILAVALATTLTSSVSASEVDTVVQCQSSFVTNDIPAQENGWTINLGNGTPGLVEYVICINGVEVGRRVVLPGGNQGYHIPFDPELVGTTVTVKAYDRNGLIGSRDFMLTLPN